MLLLFFILQILKTTKPENFQESSSNISEIEDNMSTDNFNNIINECKCSDGDHIHREQSERENDTNNDETEGSSNLSNKMEEGLNQAYNQNDGNLIDATLFTGNQDVNRDENSEEIVRDNENMPNYESKKRKNKPEHLQIKRKLSNTDNDEVLGRRMFKFGENDKIENDTNCDIVLGRRMFKFGENDKIENNTNCDIALGRKMFKFGEDDKIKNDNEDIKNNEMMSEDITCENNALTTKPQQIKTFSKQNNQLHTSRKRKTVNKGKQTSKISDKELMDQLKADQQRKIEENKLRTEENRIKQQFTNNSNDVISKPVDKPPSDTIIHTTVNIQQLAKDHKLPEILNDKDILQSQKLTKQEEFNEEINEGISMKETTATAYRKTKADDFVPGTNISRSAKKKKKRACNQQVRDIPFHLNNEFISPQENNNDKQIKKPNETTGMQILIPSQNTDENPPLSLYLEAICDNKIQEKTNKPKLDENVEGEKNKNAKSESQEGVTNNASIPPDNSVSKKISIWAENEEIIDLETVLSYLGLKDSSDKKDDNSKKIMSTNINQIHENKFTYGDEQGEDVDKADSDGDGGQEITIDQSTIEQGIVKIKQEEIKKTEKEIIKIEKEIEEIKEEIEEIEKEIKKIEEKMDVIPTHQEIYDQNEDETEQPVAHSGKFTGEDLVYYTTNSIDQATGNKYICLIVYLQFKYRFENLKINIYDYFFENLIRIKENNYEKKYTFVSYEEHNYIGTEKNQININNKLNLEFYYQNNTLRYKITHQDPLKHAQNMTHKEHNIDTINEEHLKVRYLIYINGIFVSNWLIDERKKIYKAEMNTHTTIFLYKIFHGLPYIFSNDTNVFYNIYGLKKENSKIILDYNLVKETEKIRAEKFPHFTPLGSYTQFLNECIENDAVDNFFVRNTKFNSDECRVPKYFCCSPWIIEDYHEDTKLKVFRYFGIYNMYTGRYRFKVVMDNVCQNENCFDFSDPYMVFEFEQFHHEFLVVTRVNS